MKSLSFNKSQYSALFKRNTLKNNKMEEKRKFYFYLNDVSDIFNFVSVVGLKAFKKQYAYSKEELCFKL